jgi:uncharacterized RDD family membrane protein YckC
MQEDNPYASPSADVETVPDATQFRLGGRGERLVAVLIDSLLVGLLTVPAMFLSGAWQQVMQDAMQGVKPGWDFRLIWGAAGLLAYALVQAYPLHLWGQSWGKRVLKLKIVDLHGRKPDLVRLLLVRYASTRVLALVPFAGKLYGFIDPLFIFREDKRCIHDHIAGTRVVVAE